MHNLFHVYDCPNCGKKLSDEIYTQTEIDCANDETIGYFACNKCDSEVKPRLIDGIQVMEEVSEERAYWAYYEDCDDDYDGDNEDWDDDYDDDDTFDEDDCFDDCGMMADGFCGHAGSEYCDFECPFNE